MILILFYLVVSVEYLPITSAVELFQFCKITDRQVDKCLAKHIEDALKVLKSDVPEYGVKSLENLHVDKITIDAGSKGVLNLVQYYDNIIISGFTDATIPKAHYDAKKKNLKFTADFPVISQEGHYKIDGSLMGLPAQGEGDSSLILSNVTITFDIQFVESDRNGQTFFKIESLKLDIAPQNLKIRLDNLFNGNKLLGTNLNNLLNQEWKALFEDVKLSVDKGYGEIIQKYAEQFFDKIPADKIFPK